MGILLRLVVSGVVLASWYNEGWTAGPLVCPSPKCDLSGGDNRSTKPAFHDWDHRKRRREREGHLLIPTLPADALALGVC